jgi:hypothetical protein
MREKTQSPCQPLAGMEDIACGGWSVLISRNGFPLLSITQWRESSSKAECGPTHQYPSPLQLSPLGVEAGSRSWLPTHQLSSPTALSLSLSLSLSLEPHNEKWKANS